MSPVEDRRAPEGLDAARQLERADQQAILDNLPAMIAYWDKDLHNRLANKAYVEYFGQTPEQIFGHHISELLGPELYQKNLPYLERALAGERQEFDREIPTPSGPRYTQALYLPDVDDAGEVRGIFVLVTDISERRRAEVALVNAEARFRILFESGPSATLMTDETGTIVSASPAAARLFGHPVDVLEGMAATDLLEPEDVSSSVEIREALFSGQHPHVTRERRYRHADGHLFWAQVDATLVRGLGPGDDAPYVLSQLLDISARKSYESEMEYLANHDVLTGVLNRRGLNAELTRQAANAGTGSGPGAVLICDLDRFKQVNDELGHDAGDELLVHVASLLVGTVRSTDVVGRLGGDEFAVILPDEDLAGALTVAEQIQSRLRASTGRRWSDIPVAISIGAAEFAPGRTVDQTLGEADKSMYAVKAHARDAPPDA